MKALLTRLRRLETRFESAIAAMQPPRPSPVPMIVELLDRWGVVREPNESVIETLGRAIGRTPRQIRDELRRRAGLNRW
ncbi:MAG: hypothetical protein ABSH47_27675 [Bryobacteraceae bacterium]|jgi:hypothetical protein